MPRHELDAEIADGVVFWGYELEGALLGNHRRSAGARRRSHPPRYDVLPGRRRHGVGGALLEHLVRRGTRRTLVGT
ncbi:MAG TPA: hypothetical protein VM299_06355 [Solirubrobacteraceae bacterium]|jgi:GNAT superfamily N-acetyltransferase|nr:hypothetical protein [Solirubrobacteraceae bacterium]